MSEGKHAYLVVIYGPKVGHRHYIPMGETTLGDAPGHDICLGGGPVSRKLAKVTRTGDRVRICDLSTKGIYVNEAKVLEAELADDDLIKVGRAILKVFIREDTDPMYQEEPDRISTLDDLTGLFNARYFAETLEREVSRARRYDRPLALVSLDIDDFGRFNATHGSHVGDQVLRRVAELVRDRSRKVDVVTRYDGDELAVILPECDLPAALRFGETLRAWIEQTRFEYEGHTIALTVSVGVAALSPERTTRDELIALARARLHQAKAQHGNRVEPCICPDHACSGWVE